MLIGGHPLEGIDGRACAFWFGVGIDKLNQGTGSFRIFVSGEDTAADDASQQVDADFLIHVHCGGILHECFIDVGAISGLRNIECLVNSLATGGCCDACGSIEQDIEIFFVNGELLGVCHRGQLHQFIVAFVDFALGIA
jgi:hypothetical protein